MNLGIQHFHNTKLNSHISRALSPHKYQNLQENPERQESFYMITCVHFGNTLIFWRRTVHCALIVIPHSSSVWTSHSLLRLRPGMTSNCISLTPTPSPLHLLKLCLLCSTSLLFLYDSRFPRFCPGSFTGVSILVITRSESFNECPSFTRDTWCSKS